MTDTNKNVTDLISPILQILWHVKKKNEVVKLHVHVYCGL